MHAISLLYKTGSQLQEKFWTLVMKMEKYTAEQLEDLWRSQEILKIPRIKKEIK